MSDGFRLEPVWFMSSLLMSWALATADTLFFGLHCS